MATTPFWWERGSQTAYVGGVTARGEGTTALTLTGSFAAIDAALVSLTYRAGAAAGTDWLWVSASDSNGNQGISYEIVTCRWGG